MARPQIPVTFKATAELKAWLASQAESGYRSVSAEIAMKLEKLMTADQKENAPAVAAARASGTK